MFLFWKLKSSKAWGVSLIFKDRSQKHLKLNWKLLDKINNQVSNALSLFHESWQAIIKINELIYKTHHLHKLLMFNVWFSEILG